MIWFAVQVKTNIKSLLTNEKTKNQSYRRLDTGSHNSDHTYALV